MITDKDKFWIQVPVADSIFSYVKETPEISSSPWGFDGGDFNKESQYAFAQFSCTSISGWGKDILTVTAKKQTDGSWLIKHHVTQAT